MVVSAQVTPVDGVDVTFGYTNDSAANDLLVTAKADIAKLAGLTLLCFNRTVRL